jgi:uncharacterized protein YndB with AHSA1/START domain
MHSIYHDFIINSSKEKVFNAFTTPNHLNNWWTLKSSGKPFLDEVYNLNFTHEYNWFAKVTEVELNQKFYLSMTISSDDWQSTTFGIALENHQNGTLVKFTHKGWKTINDEFRNTSFCWAILLNDLKNYLEKGTVIPFEERN